MNSNERGAGKFRASVPGASTQMPEFMRDHAGRGKETGFGPEDLSWLGDDGNLNFEQLLAKRGFDPLLPLEYILLAIIDGYPTDGTDRGSKRQRRLETALAALVGPEQRKRGMDEKADYELLLRMGWQYHCLFWNSGGKPPDVTNLAKRCYEDLPTDDPRRHASSQSVITRLRRKFTKDKDLYIARAAEQYNFQRMDKLREMRRVVKGLRDLGVSVDLNVLKPPILSRDENPV